MLHYSIGTLSDSTLRTLAGIKMEAWSEWVYCYLS